MVAENDMVILALLGFPKSWHIYQDSVNGWGKLSDWERLWSNLMQKETRKNTRDGSSSKTHAEENYTLAIKERRGNGKLPIPNQILVMELRRKILQKLSAFCHELGYFATNCPIKKSKKKSS